MTYFRSNYSHFERALSCQVHTQQSLNETSTHSNLLKFVRTFLRLLIRYKSNTNTRCSWDRLGLMPTFRLFSGQCMLRYVIRFVVFRRTQNQLARLYNIYVHFQEHTRILYELLEHHCMIILYTVYILQEYQRTVILYCTYSIILQDHHQMQSMFIGFTLYNNITSWLFIL